MKKIILVSLLSVFIACDSKKKSSGKLKVVSTTTMLTDLLKNIGGDKIELQGLMGAGVDPHLYKATAGDTQKIVNSDVLVYSGLHLENKFEEIFKKMEQQKKHIIVASDALEKSDLFESKDFEGNYDPHMWFDTNNWIKITKHVTKKLTEIDPKNADYYTQNGQKYVEDLEKLTKELTAKVNELPVEKRIMVTAHDAFNYFGRQHKFKVVGLQGLSTASEAGAKDVIELANFIIKHKLKAIFVESSVPPSTIEAVQASVRDKGHEVEIGGTLYSDALGNPGTEDGTYIGMYKTNVKTIVEALK